MRRRGRRMAIVRRRGMFGGRRRVVVTRIGDGRNLPLAWHRLRLPQTRVEPPFDANAKVSIPTVIWVVDEVPVPGG